MKLISLRLKNFRQHRDSKVKFLDGMTAIVGPNGSGKTTLLEAITFALFGEQRSKKESIKYLWAEENDKFAVELVFSFDGRRYRIVRDDTKAFLEDTTEDVPIKRATSLTAVTRESKRLLRLNYQQFVNSFCAEQKRLGFLDFDKSTRLQEEVARMLGYDRIGRAASLGRSYAKQEQARADGIKDALGDPEKLVADIHHAKVEMKNREKQVIENTDKLRDLGAREHAAKACRVLAEQYTKLDSECNAIVARAAGLRDAEKMAKSALDRATAEMAERTSIEPLAKEYLECASNLKLLEAERESARRHELLREKEADLLKRIADCETSIAAIPAHEVKTEEDAIAMALTRITATNAQALELEATWRDRQEKAQWEFISAKTRCEADMEQLSKASRAAEAGECSECGQAIAESYRASLKERHSALAAAREVVAALERKSRESQQKPAELLRAQEELEKWQVAHREAQARLEHALRLESQRKAMAESLERERSVLSDVRRQIAEAKSSFDANAHGALLQKCEELRPQSERFIQLGDAPVRFSEATANHVIAVKNLEEAKSSYEDLKAKLKECGFESAEEAKKAIQAHDDLAHEITRCTTQLANDQEMLSKAQLALDAAQKRHEEFQTKKVELDERISAARHYKVASFELDLLRERLNREIGPDLEARASDNLSALTDGRYPRLTLDNEFRATIVDGYQAKAVISGGEEDILWLSLRLALSELIQERNGMPLSLLILDEVFGGLDQDRRSNVLQRLMALKSRFSQILVISHIEDINQVADQCIYVTRDAASNCSVVSDLDRDEAIPTVAAVQIQERLFADV